MADDLPTAFAPSEYKPGIPESLKLTPQEKHLYQHHLDNLTGKGGITTPDGRRETVKQITVGLGNRVYNLPTVWNGKELPPQTAVQRAKAEGLRNFPSYPDEVTAQSRYNQMHEFMDRDVKVAQAIENRPSFEEWQKQGARKDIAGGEPYSPSPQIKDLQQLFRDRILQNAPTQPGADVGDIIRQFSKLPGFAGLAGGQNI